MKALAHALLGIAALFLVFAAISYYLTEVERQTIELRIYKEGANHVHPC